MKKRPIKVWGKWNRKLQSLKGEDWFFCNDSRERAAVYMAARKLGIKISTYRSENGIVVQLKEAP